MWHLWQQLITKDMSIHSILLIVHNIFLCYYTFCQFPFFVILDCHSTGLHQLYCPFLVSRGNKNMEFNFLLCASSPLPVPCYYCVAWGGGALCVEMGFKQTCPGRVESTEKLKYKLIFNKFSIGWLQANLYKEFHESPYFGHCADLLAWPTQCGWKSRNLVLKRSLNL